MGERSEIASRDEIFEFRCGCRDPARDLVATGARQHSATALRGHILSELPGSFVSRASSTRSCCKVVAFEFKAVVRSDVDLAPSAATLFFYLRKVGALVPVGLGIVVVGDSIEPRRFRPFPRDEDVCYADDRRRIYPPAQFGEHRTIRAESPSNCL